MLLDEPTAALDLRHRHELLTLLRACATRAGPDAGRRAARPRRGGGDRRPGRRHAGRPALRRRPAGALFRAAHAARRLRRRGRRRLGRTGASGHRPRAGRRADASRGGRECDAARMHANASDRDAGRDPRLAGAPARAGPWRRATARRTSASRRCSWCAIPASARACRCTASSAASCRAPTLLDAKTREFRAIYEEERARGTRAIYERGIDYLEGLLRERATTSTRPASRRSCRRDAPAVEALRARPELRARLLRVRAGGDGGGARAIAACR